MPLHTIGKLLSATDELKALQARTRRLLELQTLYFRSAPRELASASRVINFQTGTLFVSADNSAVAAKLRQLAPRLVASIRSVENEVTGIRIGVQVSGLRAVPQVNKNALTSGALEKFDALSKRVTDRDLQSALARLVRHHRTRKR